MPMPGFTATHSLSSTPRRYRRRPRPAAQPSGVQPARAGFCDDKGDANYANPDDCGSYITCSNGSTYVMPCPPGLHFNADKNRPFGYCDWPENVDCRVSAA